MQPTFREWARINGRGEWPRRPIPQSASSDPFAYYCPYPPRNPIFTPTDKQPGDLVLGAGYKWRVI